MPVDTPTELRSLDRRVLEHIEAANGEWLTRADVSRLMGRPKVYPTDIAALDKLVALGLIEVREGVRGGVAIRWEYRAKQGK